MANSTNTLQATIVATDANGNSSWNRGLGNPFLAGNYGDGFLPANFPVGTFNVGTPNGNPIRNLYIKNDSAPGSGITVTINVGFNGAPVALRSILQPGGVDIFWNVINTAPASDMTGLQLVIAGGTATIEMFFGG